jgi:hypothetical protein
MKYEIAKVITPVDNSELFWTGDGYSMYEFGALLYNDLETATLIISHLKSIDKLQGINEQRYRVNHILDNKIVGHTEV